MKDARRDCFASAAETGTGTMMTTMTIGGPAGTGGIARRQVRGPRPAGTRTKTAMRTMSAGAATTSGATTATKMTMTMRSATTHARQ